MRILTGTDGSTLIDLRMYSTCFPTSKGVCLTKAEFDFLVDCLFFGCAGTMTSPQRVFSVSFSDGGSDLRLRSDGKVYHLCITMDAADKIIRQANSIED